MLIFLTRNTTLLLAHSSVSHVAGARRRACNRPLTWRLRHDYGPAHEPNAGAKLDDAFVSEASGGDAWPK